MIIHELMGYRHSYSGDRSGVDPVEKSRMPQMKELLNYKLELKLLFHTPLSSNKWAFYA